MSEKIKVFLNVYDLTSNDFSYMFGFGQYHSGIEIRNTGLLFN
jgi:hypothetical protein